jgi:hypothetical protein
VAPGAGPAVRLLLDAGLVEAATSAGEYAALRLPSDGPVRLVVPAGQGDVRVMAHAMPVSGSVPGEDAAIVGGAPHDRSDR